VGAVAFGFVFLSFIFGVALYFISHRYLEKKYRQEHSIADSRADNPFNNHMSCHIIFGYQCAINAMFSAFPFSPTRSAEEWWWGYVISEGKLYVVRLLF
jgi:hypothetical protein